MDCVSPRVEQQMKKTDGSRLPPAPESKALALISRPALLHSEFVIEFKSLGAALEQEIKPRGFIERLYVADIAAIVSEIARLRIAKRSSSTWPTRRR